MEQWKSENNPRMQLALCSLCIAAGVILMAVARSVCSPGSASLSAGYFLGLLLVAIALLGYLAIGKQTVVVDPATQCITVEDKTPFGLKRQSIKFSDILEVGIGYLGKRSNFVRNYYLILKLRSGEDYALFAPGRFYKGASDRSVVEGWKARLEKYIAAG
jgi:hypothetical protein